MSKYPLIQMTKLLKSQRYLHSMWRYMCQRQASTKHLFVDKSDALVDEEIKIQVHGLRPYEKATLRATYVSECKNNTTFQSFAHYKADSNGCIDLAESTSLSGSYTGAEPMGLFWSMTALENIGITKTRINVSHASMPVKTKLDLHQGFIDFNMKKFADVEKLCDNLKTVESLSLNRYYLAQDRVEEETVRVGRLRGSVFYPKTAGKFKGIIDISGSNGGILPGRAALLASKGFTTFSLPYIYYDDLPRDMGLLEIEYFEEALEWFMNHPKVESGPVGLIASSMGFQFALLLASRKINQVAAVIGVNGLDYIVVWPIFADGKPLPFEPAFSEKIQFNKDGHCNTRDCVSPFPTVKEAAIPVKDMKSKLLIIACEDDDCFNSDSIGKQMAERMRKHGKEDQCRLILYPKAGHLLEPPYMPNCSHAYDRSLGRTLSFGGDAKHHALAQKDAWSQIINFLKKNI